MLVPENCDKKVELQINVEHMDEGFQQSHAEAFFWEGNESRPYVECLAIHLASVVSAIVGEHRLKDVIAAMQDFADDM